MDLEELRNKIKNIFEEIDYYNIYYILKDNNENMTANKAGVFFDLSSLKKETLQKINYIVEIRIRENKK